MSEEERVATLPELAPEIKEAARQAGGGWLDEVVGHHHSGPVPISAVRGAWRLGPDGELTGEYVANPNYQPAAERPRRCPFGY